MWLLATICDQRRVAVLLDFWTGIVQDIPSRPEFIDPAITDSLPYRPFGISWHGDELYITNNYQILVFDYELVYKRTLAVAMQPNLHQLAYHEGYLWAVSPRSNSLIGVDPEDLMTPVEFDLLTHKLRAYNPTPAIEAADKYHFNSLLWSTESLFVTAHNFGPSFISCYSRSCLNLTNIIYGAGSSVHGLAFRNDELFWLSTGSGEIRSNRGYIARLSRAGYARGFAMTERHFVVALSQALRRDERTGGHSWIQVIDRKDGSLVSEHCLRDTGSINDLRLLDMQDYAHGVMPFWR